MNSSLIVRPSRSEESQMSQSRMSVAGQSRFQKHYSQRILRTRSGKRRRYRSSDGDGDHTPASHAFQDHRTHDAVVSSRRIREMNSKASGRKHRRALFRRSTDWQHTASSFLVIRLESLRPEPVRRPKTAQAEGLTSGCGTAFEKLYSIAWPERNRTFVLAIEPIVVVGYLDQVGTLESFSHSRIRSQMGVFRFVETDPATAGDRRCRRRHRSPSADREQRRFTNV